MTSENELYGQVNPDEELFGDIGNFEDYWLGVPDRDNTSGQPGWASVNKLIDDIRVRETTEWANGKYDEIEAYLEHDMPDGGGLTGIDGFYLTVKHRIMEQGMRALELEQGFRAGKRGRQ